MRSCLCGGGSRTLRSRSWGSGFGAIAGLAISAETHSEPAAPGGKMATFIGSVTGLVGMYLALVMVLLAQAGSRSSSVSSGSAACCAGIAGWRRGRSR